jgi:uncharacterized damage-inducible protein DinB
MPHALHDLIRHNNWATKHLLEYCQNLDEQTLNSAVPGTYGTIIHTLRHLLGSEASYLRRLTGAWPSPPWTEDDEADIAVLLDRASQLAVVWEQFLASDEVDTEQLGEGRGDDGLVFAIRASIFYTQALHHANEHRAHVCTIIGALGHEAPDVSVWEYALAAGRSWVKTD